MENTRLQKCVMFGELVGGGGCKVGHGKDLMKSTVFDQSQPGTLWLDGAGSFELRYGRSYGERR